MRVGGLLIPKLGLFSALIAGVLPIGKAYTDYPMDLSEIRPLYRGMRCTAMGGACIAMTEGDEALFLNPAALAKNRSFELHYTNADFGISYRTGLLDEALGLASSGISLEVANFLMGKSIYTQLTTAPMLLGPGFGIGFLYDAQIAFYAQNPNLPQITLGGMFTRGFQLGAGISLMPGRRRGDPNRHSDLRIGIASKVMWRRGGYYRIPAQSLFEAERRLALTDEIIGVAYNFGLGFDVGLQGQFPIDQTLTFHYGAHVLDISDTEFGAKANPSLSNMGLGAGLRFRRDKFQAAFEYDLRNIASDYEGRKWHHFGFEFSMPFLTLYTGYQETNFTYGLGLDVWLFKFSFTSYAAELGAQVSQFIDRRYLTRVDLKFEF